MTHPDAPRRERFSRTWPFSGQKTELLEGAARMPVRERTLFIGMEPDKQGDRYGSPGGAVRR